MKSKRTKIFRKVMSFLLAAALVATLMPGMSLKAHAVSTMVGQYIRTPGRGGSNTMTFSGASDSNPIYITIAGHDITITSETATLSHTAQGAYDKLQFNGTEIYSGGWNVGLGYYIASGSGTESDRYVFEPNSDRGTGARFSDFHAGDRFMGYEIELTANSLTLPAMDGKYITVTTGETSNTYSLETGVTLTGLEASSTFDVYKPDISTATINMENNSANITSVRHDDKNLTETTEYTVQYTDADNNNIEKPGALDYGSYHVTVTGAGKYSGSVTKDFSIVKIQTYNVTLSDDENHSKTYQNKELPLNLDLMSLFREWYSERDPMDYDTTISTNTESFTVRCCDWMTGNDTNVTIHVSIEENKSKVTTAPTAIENLTANGSAQALLDTSNVEVENGTMYYALGTNNETAPTSGWSATSPNGNLAKSYYVWYKAVGNTGFADTVPVCLTVTISESNITSYSVTYKVVNGTWSDDSTTDKTETVERGSKPASVPTGMKASEGYEDGAWNTDPGEATITQETTFTYKFVAKSSEQPQEDSAVVEFNNENSAAQTAVTKIEVPGAAEEGSTETSTASDTPFTQLLENEKTNNPNDDVKIKLIVTPKGHEDLKNSASVSGNEHEDLRDEIKGQFTEAAFNDDKIIIDVLDIQIKKTVGNAPATDITDTGANCVQEVVVDYDLSNKNDIVIVREHNDQAVAFTEIKGTLPIAPFTDERFYIEGSGASAKIHIYSRFFSNYVIAYSTQAGQGANRQTVNNVNPPVYYYTPSQDEAPVISGTTQSTPVRVPKTIPVYRLYNSKTGEHFYTINETEKKGLEDDGWTYEGVAWNTTDMGDIPVYRLFDAGRSGQHRFTSSEAEKNAYVADGWTYEGIAWLSEEKEGKTVYKLTNPNAKAHKYHFTANREEVEVLIALGWKEEEADFTVK